MRHVAGRAGMTMLSGVRVFASVRDNCGRVFVGCCVPFVLSLLAWLADLLCFDDIDK